MDSYIVHPPFVGPTNPWDTLWKGNVVVGRFKGDLCMLRSVLGQPQELAGSATETAWVLDEAETGARVRIVSNGIKDDWSVEAHDDVGDVGEGHALFCALAEFLTCLAGIQVV